MRQRQDCCKKWLSSGKACVRVFLNTSTRRRCTVPTISKSRFLAMMLRNLYGGLLIKAIFKTVIFYGKLTCDSETGNTFTPIVELSCQITGCQFCCWYFTVAVTQWLLYGIKLITLSVNIIFQKKYWEFHLKIKVCNCIVPLSALIMFLVNQL